ncbi:hypothetical protein ACW7BC_29655 [Azospirillum argentinense]|uniref:hypothetical protein n=1 Tax=Azospirillum argentinense TaxID=2970906 RepID=UPI001FFE38C9|nr:hypothetical protein [Azospirillum argentinense]
MPPASRSAQDRDAGGGRRVLQRHEVAQVCAADPQPLPVRLQAEQLHQDMDQRPHPIDAKRQEAGVADRHVQRALRRQGLQRRIDVGRAGLVLPTVPDIAARIEGTGIEAVQDGDHRAQDWQQVDPLAADLHAEGDAEPVDAGPVVQVERPVARRLHHLVGKASINFDGPTLDAQRRHGGVAEP